MQAEEVVSRLGPNEHPDRDEREFICHRAPRAMIGSILYDRVYSKPLAFTPPPLVRNALKKSFIYRPLVRCFPFDPVLLSGHPRPQVE